MIHKGCGGGKKRSTEEGDRGEGGGGGRRWRKEGSEYGMKRRKRFIKREKEVEM